MCDEDEAASAGEPNAFGDTDLGTLFGDAEARGAEEEGGDGRGLKGVACSSNRAITSVPSSVGVENTSASFLGVLCVRGGECQK